MVHSEAEEQVVYPKMREFFEQTQQLYDEQAELKEILKAAKASEPATPEFKSKVMGMKRLVETHTDEEESDMFFQARRNLSSDQLKEMGTEFKEAKKQLQTQMSS